MIALLALLAAAVSARAAKNGLSLTPPLGWSSWNAYGCTVNEDRVRAAADEMSARFAAAGYKYVNIDDCWAATTRDLTGRLQANLSSFPSGIQALADYAHERGLFLGIYSSAGTATCEGRAGSLGSERVDAITCTSSRELGNACIGR